MGLPLNSRHPLIPISLHRNFTTARPVHLEPALHHYRFSNRVSSNLHELKLLRKVFNERLAYLPLLVYL